LEDLVLNQTTLRVKQMLAAKLTEATLNQ